MSNILSRTNNNYCRIKIWQAVFTTIVFNNIVGHTRNRRYYLPSRAEKKVEIEPSKLLHLSIKRRMRVGNFFFFTSRVGRHKFRITFRLYALALQTRKIF